MWPAKNGPGSTLVGDGVSTLYSVECVPVITRHKVYNLVRTLPGGEIGRNLGNLTPTSCPLIPFIRGTSIDREGVLLDPPC